MNTSKRLGRTVAFLGALCAAAGVHAQGAVTSWQVAGGFIGSSITARADWSSDLGPPWVFGNAAQNGSTVWTGPGTNAASGPYGLTASGITLDYSLNPRGGAAGHTYSGGTLQITDAHPLDTPARSDFHLYSVLGANEPVYGISTTTRVEGFFGVTAYGTPYAPLHYRVDWTLATQGDAGTDNQVYFDDQWRTLGAGSGSFAGVFDASDYLWWTNGDALFPHLILGTSAYDAAGSPRSGRTDLWLSVSFARAPIAAVPEPGTAPTLAVGVLLLAVARRRWQAAPQPERRTTP